MTYKPCRNIQACTYAPNCRYNHKEYPVGHHKTKLLDHISFAYNVLSAKYQNGLHFILAGDTNELKLDSILHLNLRMQQLVQGPTRMNPPRMLDPILTTLGCYYQSPVILPPLGSDPD